MKTILGAVAIVTASAGLVCAQEAVTYSYDGSFDDATFGVESAIVDRGLVVDHVSHVGDMLNRTAGDVGAEETIFDGANIYQFCSAVLSRKMMEADPMNLIHCPYGVFVSERGSEVTIGYRTYPEGAMQEVQMLLDEIAREAAGI
jgi:uncharacterized protein (DUF302 family)